MAFWVVDGARPLRTLSSRPAADDGELVLNHHCPWEWRPERGREREREPIYHGSTKRRVSNSEGSLDVLGYKRIRRADAYGPFYDQNRPALDPRDCSRDDPVTAGTPLYEYDFDHGGPHRHIPDGGVIHSYDQRPDWYREHDREPPVLEPRRPSPGLLTTPDSIPVKNLAFLVIRERSPTPDLPLMEPSRFGPDADFQPGGCRSFSVLASPSAALPLAPSGPAHLAPYATGAPESCAMERTASGLSVSSDTTQPSFSGLEGSGANDAELTDAEAAFFVRDHVTSRRLRCPDSRAGRILKALVNPKSRGADFPLDNDALRSIFKAANYLFFDGSLTDRVAWDWSHPASAQYKTHIVGSTALRRSQSLGGWETLIILSSPILRDTKYNRRLLISTFLHEMIHSFLFVKCGLAAKRCGGHTEGFREIANIIDGWVGRGFLRLSEIEADLEQFRDDADARWPGTRPEGSPQRRQWDGRTERDRGDFYPGESAIRPWPPQDFDERPWQDRDGFRARPAGDGARPGSGGSTYVQ